MMADVLVFYVNGEKVEIVNPDPSTTLLEYLRDNLQLTGAKRGCNGGQCGSCTVMASRHRHHSQATSHRQVPACLVPLCWCHGQALTTVEGLGSSHLGLLPIQRGLAERGGVQCGFCTPGMVMSVFTLLRNSPTPPGLEDIRSALEGNLCRCTGYRGILDGFLEGIQQTQCCQQRDGQGCPCRRENGPSTDSGIGQEEKSCNIKEGKCIDQVAIFPPELKLWDGLERQTLEFQTGALRWIRPCSLADLLQWLSALPCSTVVGACCSLGGVRGPGTLVAVGGVGELAEVELTPSSLSLGSALSLTSLLEHLAAMVTSLPEAESRHLSSVRDMASKIASPLIRNLGTVGGNLMGTGYPSDLRTVLVALGAKVTFSKKGGERVISMWDTADSPLASEIQASEVLTFVSIPLSTQTENSYVIKVQERPGFSTATVNAALVIGQEQEEGKVKVARLALGGHFCPPGVIMTIDLSPTLSGKELSSSSLNAVLETVNAALASRESKGDSLSAYHHQLVLGCVFQLFSRHLGTEPLPDPTPSIPYGSTRAFQPVGEGQAKADPVGRPVAQFGGLHMTSGETIFVDDLPKVQGELRAGLVLSSRSHAKLVSVDWSKVKGIPGVAGHVDQADIPGLKLWAAGGVRDVPVFALDEVVFKGQIIGLVLADSEKTAKMAASKVAVTYSDLPSIITIQDAIAAKSYFTAKDACPELAVGDVEAAMTTEGVTVATGHVTFDGQEHWYMEPQCSLVVPRREHQELEVHTSSHCITGNQTAIASVLGIPSNRVTVHARRLGGSFGGKEQNSSIVAIPAAVAAFKYKKPVRCVLDREVDLQISGKRAPFLTKYKVGYQPDGTIVALDVEMYLNSGIAVNLNRAILQYAVQNMMGSYRVPNMRVKGFLCRTNLPPNTAFRGFGSPEAVLSSELIVDKVACTLGLPRTQVQLRNLYKEGDVTFTNQTLSQCNLGRCYQECRENSAMEERTKAVEEFNREHTMKKRGLALVPLKFPIGFREHHLSQAGALVHVYQDGSVWLTHGGIEMGQGLHLKMMQVAARELGVSLDKVHTSQVSTSLVPNTTATAASFSADLYGHAVQNACQQLMTRLAPLREKEPDLSWESLVIKAYFQRVSLSAFGFYKTEGSGPEWTFARSQGAICDYYSYGAGCSEVEVDLLTGQHRVLRVDIVMDVGQSLNPLIDMGQVEGAFLQGYGMMMMESAEVGEDGTVMPEGLKNYKIPGVRNIPEEFHVSFLKNSHNHKGIYSAKGVGEPPLLLAVSVLVAAKEAVRAARQHSALSPDFLLHCPALPQRLLSLLSHPCLPACPSTDCLSQH